MLVAVEDFAKELKSLQANTEKKKLLIFYMQRVFDEIQFENFLKNKRIKNECIKFTVVTSKH